MEITLSPETEKRIIEKIERGEYESADAIVEQAISFFLDYEEDQMDSEEFSDAARGIEQGLQQTERGEGISVEEFDQNMRRKLASWPPSR